MNFDASLRTKKHINSNMSQTLQNIIYSYSTQIAYIQIS